MSSNVIIPAPAPALATATPATASAPRGRVLDYRTGARFLPAIGHTVDTRIEPWAAVGAEAKLAPALYRVTAHTISAEPNKSGRVSANAGKPTVRVTPIPGVAEARAAVEAARVALAEAEATLAEAEALATPGPVAASAPVAGADVPDALANLSPDDLAKLLAAVQARA